MKKSIALFTALTALYMCWKSLRPPPESFLMPSKNFRMGGTRAPTPIPKAADTAPLDPNDPPLATLERELAQLDHELERAGYPEVLLDERLRDAEREDLISKALRSTDLYDRVARMRVAQPSRAER